jgi:hypothetical protein
MSNSYVAEGELLYFAKEKKGGGGGGTQARTHLPDNSNFKVFNKMLKQM